MTDEAIDHCWVLRRGRCAIEPFRRYWTTSPGRGRASIHRGSAGALTAAPAQSGIVQRQSGREHPRWCLHAARRAWLLVRQELGEPQGLGHAKAAW
jgi:hypothetical protein